MRTIGVVIGRFQPLHLGHEALIKHALSRCAELVVVLGSAGKAPTVRNPWTDLGRAQILNQVLPNYKIHYARVADHYSDDAWLVSLKVALSSYINEGDEVIFFCHEKDIAYYKNVFPDWKIENVPGLSAQGRTLDATMVREVIFESDPASLTKESFEGLLSPLVAGLIVDWVATKGAQQLFREYQYIREYKQQWSGAPYAPIFVTVDGVVIYKGKLLMIRRKAEPGAGLIALPGGFIGEKEPLIDAAIREVHEETGVRLKREWLRSVKVFDNPDRSQRGRTITHAHRFDIPSEVPLKLRAASDASKAFWVDLSMASLYTEQMFEDHDQIVRAMLNVS